MSTIDQAFSESVVRLQGWLQFLERKGAEYQAQMNRVRRGGPPASDPSASEQAAAPAPEAVAEVAAEEGDAWQ